MEGYLDWVLPGPDRHRHRTDHVHEDEVMAGTPAGMGMGRMDRGVHTTTIPVGGGRVECGPHRVLTSKRGKYWNVRKDWFVDRGWVLLHVLRMQHGVIVHDDRTSWRGVKNGRGPWEWATLLICRANSIILGVFICMQCIPWG